MCLTPNSCAIRGYKGRSFLDVAFASPDVVTLIDRQDKNPAITDLASPRRFDDCFDDVLGYLIWDDEFNHNLRQKRDAIFRPSINGLVALLPAVSAHLSHCHPGNVEFRQSIFYFLELIWANDRLDQFHASSPKKFHDNISGWFRKIAFEDLIDLPGEALIFALEVIGRRITEGPRNHSQFSFVARQRMYLSVVRHLQLVLNVPQENIGLRQRVAFLA